MPLDQKQLCTVSRKKLLYMEEDCFLTVRLYSTYTVFIRVCTNQTATWSDLLCSTYCSSHATYYVHCQSTYLLFPLDILYPLTTVYCSVQLKSRVGLFRAQSQSSYTVIGRRRRPIKMYSTVLTVHKVRTCLEVSMPIYLMVQSYCNLLLSSTWVTRAHSY